MEIVFSGEKELLEIAEIEKEWTENPSSANAMKIFLTENGISLSAKIDSKVVGYVNATFFEDEAEIINIAVLEKFRNKGIGKELLNKFLNVAFDKNIKSITLEVRESNNNAISLYEKTGFAKLGKRKGFYSHPREDALIYGIVKKD